MIETSVKKELKRNSSHKRNVNYQDFQAPALRLIELLQSFIEFYRKIRLILSVRLPSLIDI